MSCTVLLENRPLPEAHRGGRPARDKPLPSGLLKTFPPATEAAVTGAGWSVRQGASGATS